MASQFSTFKIFSVKLQGANAFKSTLRKMSKGVRGAVVREAARSGGALLKQEIKSRAPVRASGGFKKSGKGQLRRPGFLKRSIGMDVKSKPSEARAKIGPKKLAFYALFVEYGTKHAPAHPFMRPAFDSKSIAAGDKSISVFVKFLAKFNRKFPG